MTRILLVDDDTAVLAVLALGLRTQLRGAQVLTVDSGARALKALDEQEFDVVITDIMMPDVEGLAVIQHVISNRPGTPCIATSGGSSKMHVDVLSLARALGARATLYKPVAIEQLARVVRGLVWDRDGD